MEATDLAIPFSSNKKVNCSRLRTSLSCGLYYRPKHQFDEVVIILICTIAAFSGCEGALEPTSLVSIVQSLLAL